MQRFEESLSVTNDILPLMSINVDTLLVAGNAMRCRIESISESVVAGGLMGGRCC